MLEECNVSCIVSLPIGVFVNAGASLKTNLLFFTKGQPTESIWYYDLADIKVNKSSPFTLKHFEEFFHLLPHRGLSSRSWITTREEITLKDFDLKASNPHEPVDSKNESAQEIIAMIESEARLVSQILTEMRAENWNGLGDKLDEQRIIGDN